MNTALYDGIERRRNPDKRRRSRKLAMIYSALLIAYLIAVSLTAYILSHP